MIKDVIITFMGHILQIYVYSVHVFVFMISTNNECNMNKQLFSGNYVVTRKLMNTRGEYNVSHITENSNRKQLKPLSCFFTYIFALLCSLSTNDIRHFEKKPPFRIVADNYHLLHPNPRVSKFRKVRHGMAVDLTPPPIHILDNVITVTKKKDVFQYFLFLLFNKSTVKLVIKITTHKLNIYNTRYY